MPVRAHGWSRRELLPFADAHAVTVAGRPASASEPVVRCRRPEFPVSAQTITEWRRDGAVRAHALVEDGRIAGYGEWWFDIEEDEVEPARIVVAPGTRGKGVGRAPVHGLPAQARGSGHGDVFMRVHPDDERALRCHRGAGFAPVEAGLDREPECRSAGRPRPAPARCRGTAGPARPAPADPPRTGASPHADGPQPRIRRSFTPAPGPPRTPPSPAGAAAQPWPCGRGGRRGGPGAGSS
ncbi:GNAT family N-acetyltransferase [Streptomyces sp. NBC_00316]|uniref:GNAT family N-acetyltransferase n=1 Tax=Streptomyces sp. NBC_00316 TaxID=2975710 RepID=UPI003FA7A412